jgi:myo-inositol 2-dehydrogenase/D-chiro-inositol 1-dehydrogenase
MGQHYLDPVQYLLEKDDTSPVEIFAEGPQQHPDACGSWRRIELRYADGCVIVLDGENRDKSAPFLEGPEGKLFRGFVSDIPGLRDKLAALPDPEAQITDFTESVRTRRRFALDERKAHRSSTLVNLAKTAVQLGRPLRYDPERETFPGDEAANRLADQPMRAPWHLDYP